ncbi:MAG: hypothetical protein PHD21_01665 [Flavobacteriales bacterium]|nr:hypothetical protein [Flavobacteriales bacterium]
MKKFFTVLSLSTLALFSCQKGEKEPTYHDQTIGYYILSEGTANKNDSKLAFYDLSTKTLKNDYFASQNPTETSGIGDTATDVIVYGSKTYIVVNISNKIIVLNSYTGALISEITLAANASPRYAVGTDGKVFVSTWNHGVEVIDTTLMTITKNISLSEKFSEGIVTKDGYVYVANSGKEGDSYGGNGTTISVISTATMQETATITVPKNPNRLAFGPNGMLYCTTWGNWVDEDMTLSKIDVTTNKVVKSYENFAAKALAINAIDIYSCAFSYITYETYFTRTSLANDTSEDALNGVSPRDYGFRSIYDVSVDPLTNDVYWLDESGLVVIFDKDGNKKGELPNKSNGGIYTRPNKVVMVTLRFPDEVK